MRALFLSLLGLVAATAGLTTAAQTGDRPTTGHGSHDAAFESCAKACSDCQRICDMCSTHCAHLLAQGQREHVKTLHTCQDCATHCMAATSIVARRGPFSDTICKACGEACARCGKACEQFSQDEHMRRCAEECRRCEKACRDMIQHVGHAAR